MSAGTYEFMIALAESLAANSAVQTLCQSYWRKNATVFALVDSLQAPVAEDNAPCIILYIGSRGVSEDHIMQSRAVTACICAMGDKDEKPVLENGVYKIKGYSFFDAFSAAVEKALADYVHPGGYYTTSVIQGPEDEIMLPYFKSWMGLSIQFDSDLT